MNQREDCADAKRIKERLYEESGEGSTKIHPSKQVRQGENQPFSRSREGAERIEAKLDGNGILLQPHPARLRRGGNHQTKWWQAYRWDEQFFF